MKGEVLVGEDGADEFCGDEQKVKLVMNLFHIWIGGLG